ncbi:hypothetical protein MKEN_00004600 [Mycena kentingensis (nom. inval.)]|nr:hypothetical protein MKEN_00004600 [Mycena kentingensis (nom. inval.)]
MYHARYPGAIIVNATVPGGRVEVAPPAPDPSTWRPCRFFAYCRAQATEDRWGVLEWCEFHTPPDRRHFVGPPVSSYLVPMPVAQPAPAAEEEKKEEEKKDANGKCPLHAAFGDPNAHNPYFCYDCDMMRAALARTWQPWY